MDAGERYEQERGKPVPGFNHSILQPRLIIALARSDKFEVMSELNLCLSGWKCVPDICLFPKGAGLLKHDIAWVTEVPLMAIEIFSPSQTMDEMTEKVDKLLEAGVKSVWLVLPAVRVISIFQQDALPISVTTGTLTDPATGIQVEVDAIFA